MRNYVSDYANGPYGRLFQVSMFTHGLGNLATAGGLGLVVGTPAGKWATTFLGLASIGILIASVFATDPQGVPQTVVGTIHLVAAFAAFPLEIVALLFFAFTFGQLPLWKGFATITHVIVVLSVLSLLWLLFAIAVGLEAGLAERMSFVTLMVWEIAVALCLATYLYKQRDNGLAEA